MKNKTEPDLFNRGVFTLEYSNMHEKLKASGMFIVKSGVFAIVFWTVWFYVMRPMTSAPASGTASSSQSKSEPSDSDALMKKYWEQVHDADVIQQRYKEQSAIADRQQKRMDTILVKQEEQARRFDAILTVWEKQTKVGK